MIELTYAVGDNALLPEDSESRTFISGKPLLRLRGRERDDTDSCRNLLVLRQEERICGFLITVHIDADDAGAQIDNQSPPPVPGTPGPD